MENTQADKKEENVSSVIQSQLIYELENANKYA